jgi:Phosphoesterase family
VLAIRGVVSRIKLGVAAVGAAALAVSMAAGTSSAAMASPAGHSAHGAPHIMEIWMENTDYSQYAASPAMPELNQMAHEYADFTRGYGWHYPSLPNYIEGLAGTDMGVTSDCDITDTGCSGFHHKKLVNQLADAGISWHAYYQGDESGCYQGDGSGNYPYWHNSFRYFADFSKLCKHISNFGPLLADLSGPHPPDFNWVVPDLVNSGGDNGTMNSGDSWLAGELPRIMATRWYRDHGQIVIIYDTGYNDSGGNAKASGGHIPIVVISAHDRGMGTIDTPVNTAGVLHSIEQAYGVGYLSDAANPANGNLGDALVSGWHGNGHHGFRQILHGALISPSRHTQAIDKTLALQGVYRPSGRRTIEVGENASGVGTVSSSGAGTVDVAGTSDLESVSCVTPSDCYAVGLATSNLDEAVLVKLVNGQPVRVTDLPAFIGLYGIACPSATTCYAVGYDNSDDAGAVTTITDGAASAPAEVPNDGSTPWLNAISCPTSTQCYAAGLVNYEPSIVPITSGTPQAAVTVANAWYLNGIDCPSVGSCVAVGENTTEKGIVATLTGSTEATTVVPGTEYLYGVGCVAGDDCLLAGAGPAGKTTFGNGVFVPDAAGTLGHRVWLSDSNGLGQVACGPTLSSCISAGAVFRP